jgi:hypothetical protein
MAHCHCNQRFRNDTLSQEHSTIAKTGGETKPLVCDFQFPLIFRDRCKLFKLPQKIIIHRSTFMAPELNSSH